MKMTTIILAIDHNNPAQVAAFGNIWRLSEQERAEIRQRAADARRFEFEVRTLGKVAAVSAQVQRVMGGAA